MQQPANQLIYNDIPLIKSFVHYIDILDQKN